MTHEQVPTQVPGFALERRSVRAIARLIADAFPGKAEAIEQDIEAAVRDLAKAGALFLTSVQ